MGNRKNSGAGGAAGELGSLHRAGVAAIFAIRGLVGSPLTGKVPVAISLETEDDVDDIVVTMEGGSRWFIQAKRSARGAQLESALEQWSRQPLDRDDLVVIATRGAGGMLKDVSEVLAVRRLDPAVPLSDKKENSLTKFGGLLNQYAGERTDSILRSASILSWSAETPEDAHAESAIARLEGTLVAASDGAAAFYALQSFFQRSAAKRLSTTSSQWVAAIRDSGISVFADGRGVPGAVTAARADALADYRKVVARRLNRLDLHLICPGVPWLEVPNFIDNIELKLPEPEQGKLDSITLPRAIRGNRRFIIQGLPGAGKSEAMRQAAAWLASDPAAPVPLLVRLGDLANVVATADDLTVDTVVAQATADQGKQSSTVLHDALCAATDSGHCIILFDGLDEAHGKRGMLAAGIAQLTDLMHPEVGCVVSTRASAEDVLHLLEFPVVRLSTAKQTSVQMLLLDRLSELLAGDDTEAWLADRKALIEDHADAHEDIWRVPLLATLATTRIAGGKASANDAAGLLRGVIEDSIERWEVQKEQGNVISPSPGFHVSMLTEGFAAIGRALNTRSDVTPAQAEATVRKVLVPWSLSKPETKLIAKFVVDFWDKKVGVFVETDDYVRARSRQFAELGDAIHAVNLDSRTKRLRWLTRSLDNPGQMNAVGLAANANADVARWLVARSTFEESETRRRRAMSWVSEFASSWQHQTTADNLATVEAFSSAVNDKLPFSVPSQGEGMVESLLRQNEVRLDESDGHGWRFAVGLALLPVSADARPTVDALIEGLPFPQERLAVLRALTVLSRVDAATTKELPSEILEVVESSLAYPVAPSRKKEPSYRDEFGTTVFPVGADEPLIFGLGQLAWKAASYASVLSSDAQDAIWVIAKRGKFRLNLEISSKLEALGFADPSPAKFAFMDSGYLNRFEESLDVRWVLDALTERFPENRSPTENEEWRLVSLRMLLEAVGISDAYFGDLRSAQETPSALVGDLLSALVVAAGLDGEVAASQARRLVENGRLSDEESYLYDARISGDEIQEGVVPNALRLPLVNVVAAAPTWLSLVALRLTMNLDDPTLAEAARNTDSPIWANQRHLAWLRLTNAEDEEAELSQLLEASSAYRAGAALVVRDAKTRHTRAARGALLEDPDATVRAGAGATMAEVESASYWTCVRCGSSSPIELYVCARCESPTAQSIKVREQLRRNTDVNQFTAP